MEPQHERERQRELDRWPRQIKFMVVATRYRYRSDQPAVTAAS